MKPTHPRKHKHNPLNGMCMACLFVPNGGDDSPYTGGAGNIGTVAGAGEHLGRSYMGYVEAEVNGFGSQPIKNSSQGESL